MTSERERQGALARAESDLAEGRTHAAIQRLRSLLVTDPGDLVVRTRLAEAYRRTGDLVQAGRWAYLTAELLPQEEAAFLRAYPSPWLRLRVLRYVGTADALPPAAAQRLRRLVVAAHLAGAPRQRTPPPEAHPEHRRGNLVPCLFVLVVMLASTVLAIIGALRVWHWWVNL